MNGDHDSTTDALTRREFEGPTRRALMGKLVAGAALGVGAAISMSAPAHATQVTPTPGGTPVFGWFDVSDYGARGDNSIGSASTNTTAFTNAVSALTTVGGGVLYVPTGVYYLNSKINMSNVAVTIRGNGRQQSVVVWTNSDGGFNYNVTGAFQYSSGQYNMRGRSLVVEGIAIGTTIVPTASGSTAGNAITGSWPDATSMESYFQIHDVTISGYGAEGTQSWTNGIVLDNVNGSRVEDVYIAGNHNVVASLQSSPTPWAMANAIYYTGTSTAGKISHFIQRLGVERANTAIAVDQWYEGFYMTNFELVYVATGFYLTSGNSPKSPAVKNPNFFIENGHINFRQTGVNATGVLNVRLVNVDLYKDGDGAAYSIAGNGVSLSGCDQFLVSGCKIESTTSSGTNENAIFAQNSIYGVVVGSIIKAFKSSGMFIDSPKTNVSGNTVVGPCGTGIWLGSSSSNVRVSSTIFDSVGTTVVNNGSSNVITA